MSTRLRHGWALGAVLLTLAPSAHAEDPARYVNTVHFTPTTGPGILTVDSAERLGHLVLRFGATWDFARDLLWAEGSNRERYIAVENQSVVNLTTAIGIWKFFELGVGLPIVNMHDGLAGVGANVALSGWDFGDLRIVPKIRLGEDAPSGFGVALIPAFTLPTGEATRNTGERGATFEPRLAVSYRFEQGSEIAANLGYRARPAVAFGRLLVDDEFTFGLGVRARIYEGFSVKGEVFGAIGVGDNSADPDTGVDEAEMPIEAIGAFAYDFDFGLGLYAGAGAGVTAGYGAPAYRAFVGATWTFDTKPPPDADYDGLDDKSDKCPTEAEDRDGRADGDGCPDPDDDGDGLCDEHPAVQERLAVFTMIGNCHGVDKCSARPEDADNFEDEDGCPDEDNDRDGVPDASDTCRDIAEDRDGFEDGDGCPDPDNDNDEFLDAADKCPDQAEVKNGVDDDDGCPDTAEVTLTDKGIEFTESIYFQLGSDAIEARSDSLLDKIAKLVLANPQVTKISVEGHTDNVGPVAYNLALSQRRAASVVQAMVTRGIAPERLASDGFGSTRPVCKENTAACKAKNRRTEFVLLEVNGKPVPK